MTNELPKRARRAIVMTYAGLWAERIVGAFWPFMSVFLVGIGLIFWAGVFQPSYEIFWGFGLLLLLGLGVFLYLGIIKFRRPFMHDAIETVDMRHPGRPLAVLDDRPVGFGTDQAADEIWNLHQQRAAERAQNIEPVGPDLSQRRQDPFALRYVAILIAFCGIVFGSAVSVSDFRTGKADTVAQGPSWEAWIEPPTYTQKPSIYLLDVLGDKVEVPVGSTATIFLYGDIGALSVSETVSGRLSDLASSADARQSFQISNAGNIEIMGQNGAIWAIDIIADNVPTIETAGDIQVDGLGQFQQPFKATDDYGITQVSAEISLNLDEVSRQHGLKLPPDHMDPILVDLPVTVTGDRANFSENWAGDFSQHAWINQPVSIRLSAQDVSGNIGTSNAYELTLPGLRFFDPLAAALVEQRRDLLWTSKNGVRISQVLRAIRVNPADVFRDPKNDDALVEIINLLEASLERDDQDAQNPDIASRLWELAIAIEEGDLANAAQAMQRAQEKLAEAMRNGASKEEIERLMQELRQATDDYIQEYAERNPPQEGQNQQGQNSDTVGQDELAEMMDRLEQLMEEGRMAEAQELLEEIDRLMENMQITEGQSGQGEGQNQSMQNLQDTLREQQELSDDAFRELQEQNNQNGQSENNQGDAENPSDQPGKGGEQGNEGQQQNGGADGLAERQQALRDELERQRRNLPGAGTQEGQDGRRALDEAGRAMDRAEEDLREGDLRGAIENQADAVDALRDGLRQLGEALAQEGQQGQARPSDRAEEQGGQPSPEDPLGRGDGNGTGVETEDGMITPEMLEKRSQELMDEIRERSADQTRPQTERDYLKRLLDLF